MKKVFILLTAVFLSIFATQTVSAGSMGDRPLRHPLLKKVRNVLWDKGINGKISYQVLHGGSPIVIELAGKQLEETKLETQKPQAKNVMPEELVRALSMPGV